MKLSVSAKGWLYAVFTALVLVFSLWLQNGMHAPGRLESGYFTACMALAVAAFTVLGIGVYAMLSFRKSRKVKHPVDAWFTAGVGLILLVTAVWVIVSYGGLSRPFDEAGYAAANGMIVILSLLPVPWLVRLFTLSFCKGEDPSTGRTVLRLLSILLVLAIPVLIVLERYFSFFYI